MASKEVCTPLVISYENDDTNNNSKMFRRTLERNGWQYKFIGQGLPWKGFKSKIEGYHKELHLHNDERIIILSDARDVFCLRKPDFLIESTRDILEDKIIVSAELFLIGHIHWNETQKQNAIRENSKFFFQGVPLDNFWSHYNKRDNLPTRKYLNSGLVMGKAKHLKSMYQWVLENDFKSDQLGLCEYTNRFPEKIHLDYDALYFHTSTSFVNGSLYNYDIQYTDTPTFQELFGLSTYFLHLPGINNSRGQKSIYHAIFEMFDKNLISNMYTLYGITPTDDKKGYKKKYFPANEK